MVKQRQLCYYKRMKAEEKKQIYNLLKTVSLGVNGYTPAAFDREDPVFTDHFEKFSASSNPISGDSTEAAVSAPEFSAPEVSAQTSSSSLENASPAAQNSRKTVSLDSIASKIQDCSRCRLAGGRTNTVPGMGVENPLVLVIGEAPGQSEDQTGKPFVGEAGQLLDKMLAAIKLSRNQNCYIANIVKCRPPQNRDPDPQEIQACISYLEAQISILKPKMILLVGRIAAQTLLKTSAGINSLRGTFYQYGSIPMMATYHPSALLRNLQLKAPAWQDLKAFRAELLKIAPGYESSFVQE